MPDNPFDPTVLDDLVRVRAEGGDVHVLTREGTSKEFKESFTWGSIGLYARTMAAFSNAKGGYLIFGVTDNPRVAVGLNQASRTAFDNLDQARLTSSLNELFSPEIVWELGSVEVSGLYLGLIYVHESDDKPVMVKKSYQQQGAALVEGDIVYRYNSRTERAKYPELKRIIEDAKKREQRLLMDSVEELIRAGAKNAAILDFTQSTLRGPMGQKVLIDEQLLANIEFIREGEFEEVAGAPTLKLVGEVVPATTIAVGPGRVVHAALSTEDVLLDFFDQSHTNNPEEYIRQATSGSTSFVPVHFYRAAAGLTPEELVELVASVTTRAQSKRKLLDRLQSHDEMRLLPPATSAQYASTVARRRFYEELSNGGMPDLDTSNATDVLRFLQAVRSLTDPEVQAVFESLLDVMKDCFHTHYSDNSRIADELRRAACRIDVAMYGSQA